MKNKIRAEEMAQVLEAQAASGLSKKAFCEEHGIAPSMFYYWQRRLVEAADKVGEEESCFTQVSVGPWSELEIRLPGGRWIGVRAGSVSVLRLVLEAMG